MTGACPDGAVPPVCYPGTTWTPNDPLFFMHHAVRVTSATRLTASPSSHHTMAPQMIDKVWYDWQNKGPENKYSYGGGSVTPLPNFTAFRTSPTGLPPYLNVSASSDLKRTRVVMVFHAFRSPVSLIARSPVTVYGMPTLRFGIRWIQQETPYATSVLRWRRTPWTVG